MQKLTLIFLVCVGLAVTMSQPVPEEIESAQDRIEARDLKRPSLGEIADRVSSAVRLSVKDEREAIAKAAQEIISAARQSVKAGVSAAQAGFQVVLMLPSIGRNVLIDTAEINKELALNP